MARVLVIGSGLAGLSAATRLVDAGHSVTVLEAMNHIGGRTSSWIESGMQIESGLHRFLGFYTALPELLQHVGIDLDTMLCWEDEIEVRTVDQDEATLGLSPLHKPLKTIWTALGHNDFLPPSDKASLVKMFTNGLKDYKQDPLKLDAITVLEYAKRHGISDKAIRNMLIPVTEGIFFVPIAQYSMHNLIGLLAPYITSLHKLRVGAFMGGMTDVMMQPVADYITERGGEVITGISVEKLIFTNDTVHGATDGLQQFEADHVVLATSLHAAQNILDNTYGYHPDFEHLFSLKTMPAVTFQLELSEPSMDIDRTTFGPETIMASFAEQSRTTFSQSDGRLSVILSQPHKYLDTPPADILRLVQEDARKLDIDITMTVREYRKVVWAHDFYSLATGSEALRPDQKTTIPGLTLAGDYTKQQHLATMEGAVVSGNRAADIVQEELS